MCGITGILGPDPTIRIDRGVVAAMTRTLAHRGPDGEGVRTGPGYGLGHRRLAIVDLARGDQPMSDEHGTLWVTYNGEIYNHEALRGELSELGYNFRTRCDTEVLLYGYREWGKDLPRHLVGMFAFAIVDESDHSLFAARDRMGQKPFCYTMQDGLFSFASELKGLLADERVPRRVDPIALGQYLCLGYVPDPLTIYEGIHKLGPGSYLSVRGGQLQVGEYWSPAPENGPSQSHGIEELQRELLDLLDTAVQGRLMGEVPLGAFLSGGIDSFAIVDSMSRVTGTKVVACTVGFDDIAFDERPESRAAAQSCGALLHEAVLHEADMLELGWFTEVFDEPFADSSAIPTYHVSRMAREHVTVALSGDGGDENFGGYRRYRYDSLENSYRSLLPQRVWSVLGACYPKLDFLPRFVRFKRTLQNLGCSPEEAYARSVSVALPEEIEPLLLGPWRTDDPLRPVSEAHRSAEGRDALSRCAHADRLTYLPGDILTKVDRASMAVSLEVRSPFLDHRVVEFAARLPQHVKLHGGESKGFLKAALRGRLGAQAMDRPKRGFSVPLRNWMRSGLGESLSAALADGPLETLADISQLRGLLATHRSGVRDHSTILWSFLVLDRFLRRWVP